MTTLDETTTAVPTVTEQERAARLLEAGSTWADRIAANPAAGRLTYKVTAASEGSVATRVRAGKHEFVVDEPAALAGDDVAPSPVEYALGALLGCQVVVYRLYAQALGLQVEHIEIEAEGDLDARKLFGISDEGRAGFTDVRLVVKVTGPESAERYQELQAAVEEHCPVLDLFANQTPVSARVEKV